MTERTIRHVPSCQLPRVREDNLGGLRESRRDGPAQRAGRPVVRRQAHRCRGRRGRAPARLDVLEEERLTVATALRGGLAAIVAVVAVLASLPGIAAADATDDYPIPNRILRTTCTAEQIMAAARDVRPVNYERYMTDYNNKSPQLQQAVQDRIHWFFSMDYAGRRQYSENIATDIYYEQLAFQWPNWAKLFFNNKGVAARTTDVCAQYPPDDGSVWVW
jgi:hypothetical protein